MDILENARKIRTQLNSLTATLTDEQALESTALFPQWNGAGVQLAADQRVIYNDVLYKVLQSHITQADWNPEAAPSLFTKVLIPDENTISEWVQPDSTNPYKKGDKVLFNGKTYESLIDGNVWSPDAYPAGWNLCE